MKSFTICPMRGPGLSHMQGTKVTLAGRTTYLPNYDEPFEVAKALTPLRPFAVKESHCLLKILLPKSIFSCFCYHN